MTRSKAQNQGHQASNGAANAEQVRQNRVDEIRKNMDAKVSPNGAVRVEPAAYWQALKEANEAG